jgi:hypothetical protein
MKRAREFDDILNECIERVLKGEPVEACLKAYPEHVAELEPLLKTAVDTRNAAAITPRPEFRQQAAYEFQSALRELRPSKRSSLRWQVRLVTALSLVVIILMAGTGTVAAASNSLPDEPLYTVKLATEDMRLALTPSALGKAELYTQFADKRVDEIIKMADKGKAAQVERVTERMNDQLVAIANLALPAGKAGEASTLTAQADESFSADTGLTRAASGQAPTAIAPPAVQGTAPTAAPTPAATVKTAPVTTPPPATAVKPTPLPTPPTAAKAIPVPTPVSPDNKGQLPPSANLSSARAPANQEITPTPAPKVAAANVTALKPVTAEKIDKANKETAQADLKNTVSQQAEKNAQKLEDVLKRVPDKRLMLPGRVTMAP